ncbi:MAG: DUF3800 domain-containing protein [Xanthobacteraceae bacterium]
MLFYKQNLHRFVGMFFFMLMRDKSIQVLAQEFENFMRSLDPADAPTLFGVDPGENPMIGQILRFVRGYNVVIARETRSLGRASNDNWNMSKPIEFVSSKDHAGIQLADLIAGVTAALPDRDEKLAHLAGQIEPHLHDECIFPDFDLLDLKGDEAPVNWLILEELACRADRGDDPLEGMDVFYELGKESVGDFREGKFSPAPTWLGRN